MADLGPLDDSPPPGFRKIAMRVNQVTGEEVRLDPPVEMHAADLDWWLRSWEPIDLLEWRIEQALHVYPPLFAPDPFSGACSTCGHIHP